MKREQIDTPALLIDLDRMERNIRRLQTFLEQNGIHNRPHIKTHKIPAIAHMQLAAGAIGITCQKLGEVEVMADAGIQHVLLTYNIIGLSKLERLMRLNRRIDLTVTVDNLTVAEGLSHAAQAAGQPLKVLVELGSAIERTGTPTVDELLALAHAVDKLPGLTLKGLMTYPSGPEMADKIGDAVSRMKAAGLSTEIVSGGGTPVYRHAPEIPGLTEHRAGTYVYNDKMMVDRGAATWDDCALTVLTTVVSRPTSDRAILDGGTKTFSSDAGLPMGRIVEYPKASIYKMNEEHAYVDLSQCTHKPQIGDRVRVIPNHACGTTNMHDRAFALRKDEVEAIWDIQARGKLQ
jgi:D-serine deaminase-like pyridoxal phosphate-dependent protein